MEEGVGSQGELLGEEGDEVPLELRLDYLGEEEGVSKWRNKEIRFLLDFFQDYFLLEIFLVPSPHLHHVPDLLGLAAIYELVQGQQPLGVRPPGELAHLGVRCEVRGDVGGEG